MTRFALKVEYDGRAMVGWQRQVNGISVQQVLEEAAARLCNNGIAITVAAGRTDSGVHATGQVVLLEIPNGLNERAIRDGLNFHMQPHAVSVVAVATVRDLNWSPRFSAVRREYRYIILNRAAPPAIGRGLVWHVKAPLDAASMQQAALRLIGKHDFTSFRALACQAASPVRTVNHFSVLRCDDQIILDVSARSFLHHQVRNFVGTLKLVGAGIWSVNRVSDVLAARDRRMAGPTAPASGLTLTRVHYPQDPFAEQQ